MSAEMTTLEKSILKAKGLTDAHLEALGAAGVQRRTDFSTIGDAATLRALLPELAHEVATEVMRWALGVSAPSVTADLQKLVVESSDVVYCVHCKTRQPKDYKTGDLCGACGKEAEPILSCFWCGSSGPGTFCRQCGAAFVPTAEISLAVLLRRDGLPKDEIPKRLKAMSAEEKETLWGRVRKARG